MPDCTKYEELCSAYVDHALSRAEKQELEAHLAECPDCRAYVEELRAMRALWRSMETPAPEGLHEQIMERIEQEARAAIAPVPAKKRRVPVFTMMAAAAACLLLAVTGSLSGVLSQADPDQAADAVVAQNSRSAQTPQAAAADDAQADAAVALPEQADDSQLQAAAPQPAADVPAAASYSSAPESAPDAAQDQTAAGTPNPKLRAAEPDAQTPMVMSVVLPPDALAGMSFANCYLAQGGAADAIPSIEQASLLVTEDGVSYYQVANNESAIAQVLEALSHAGFTVEVNAASPVALDRKADAVLFMIAAEE